MGYHGILPVITSTYGPFQETMIIGYHKSDTPLTSIDHWTLDSCASNFKNPDIIIMFGSDSMTRGHVVSFIV
jgi:hypothetical protein